ncbi:hypothetical protein [Burkholderia ambifaria]|jgi:hypothetical protein|uniref:hypothetical protein n=1 Tax=Burkholderia ambifaria TaxID=152480 RepID=UPI0015E46C0E|nr:hypothetical protein [Burkholderia ambifaria]
MNFTKIPLFHDEGAMSTGIVRDRTPGAAARRQRVGMVPESGRRPGTPTTEMFVAPRHSPRGHTGGSAKPLSLPGNGFAWRRSFLVAFLPREQCDADHTDVRRLAVLRIRDASACYPTTPGGPATGSPAI